MHYDEGDVSCCTLEDGCLKIILFPGLVFVWLYESMFYFLSLLFPLILIFVPTQLSDVTTSGGYDTLLEMYF